MSGRSFRRQRTGLTDYQSHTACWQRETDFVVRAAAGLYFRELILVDSLESPFQFERQSTHGILSLNPLINDGQWGTVIEVGNEILPELETMLSPAVVIDLSRLNYIGSPQVALLVRVWKSLKKLQGRMAIECPNETVRDILQSAGLRSLWAIVDSRDAALTALNVPRPAVLPQASTWKWFDLGQFWPATAKAAEAK